MSRQLVMKFMLQLHMPPNSQELEMLARMDVTENRAE